MAGWMEQKIEQFRKMFKIDRYPSKINTVDGWMDGSMDCEDM